MTAHVHVMPPELQARRDRLTSALANLADVLDGEDAWIIGPEHLDPLDALEAKLAELIAQVEALPAGMDN
jgi:hypothetical protein